MNIWIPALLSTTLISLVSIISIATLSINVNKLKSIVVLLVSFSAGALMGDVFIHLLPEMAADNGFTLQGSLIILSGIIFSFIMEKLIAWRHCHMPIEKNHIHNFAYMNLFGDAVHNFIDGLIIGASYMASIPVGIATTVAIVFHEVPQEIGDFGVLLHGGFSRWKAIYYNFMTALTSILGTVIALLLAGSVNNLTSFLIPFAAGSFLYIAGSDLIPELHKEENIKSGMYQTLAFIAGIGVMMSLLFLE